MRVWLERAPTVELVTLPGKGRGVMASEAIAKGTIIEVAPVIRLTEVEEAALGTTIMESYVFVWEEQDAKTGIHYPFALVMGIISMLNHSRNSNTELESDFTAQTMQLRAARDIAKGEELTIDYDCDIWFEEQH